MPRCWRLPGLHSLRGRGTAAGEERRRIRRCWAGRRTGWVAHVLPVDIADNDGGWGDGEHIGLTFWNKGGNYSKSRTPSWLNRPSIRGGAFPSFLAIRSLMVCRSSSMFFFSRPSLDYIIVFWLIFHEVILGKNSIHLLPLLWLLILDALLSYPTTGHLCLLSFPS